MRGHLAAVIDGVLHDTWNCSAEYIHGYYKEKGSAPQMLSDECLNTAVTAKLIELKEWSQIRTLIDEFAQPGQSFTKIPQERRADFLAKLASLQPKEKGSAR
jgi:hypothetical protein